MRYKVFYGNDKKDFAVVYASTTAGAEDMFRLYNPDKAPIKIEEYPENKPTLLSLTRGVDEHEFLVNLIETVQDLGLEGKVCDVLIKRYRYGVE